MSKINSFTTSTFSSQNLPTMDIETIKESIHQLMKLPPSPLKISCCPDTFNYLKVITRTQSQELFKEIGADHYGFGINVFKDVKMEFGEIEVGYTDGTKKIFNLRKNLNKPTNNPKAKHKS